MKIVIINGPNINMLGKRSEKHYGKFTLDDLNLLIEKTFPNISFEFFQSNHEGFIIDFLQNLDADGILINAAAYTHTSIGIRDALELIKIPKVEVHLSNIDQREDFRKINYIKDVVDASFYGKKEQSYIEGVSFIVDKISNF